MPNRSEMAKPEPTVVPQVPPVSGLTAEAIDILQGQKNLPKVNHLDGFYKGRGHKSECRQDWNRLRARAVTEVPFEQNLAKIQAKAQEMNVWGDHLKKTLATFKSNQSEIPNQRYITFINFNRRSDQKRMYIVDLKTGDIKAYHVAAGKGSDPDGNGYASKFSNFGKSNMSSLGCSLVGGAYAGKKGRPSLILHGLESTNDRSCDRSVVMHPAGYVGGVPGRSHGCPAVRTQDRKEIYKKVSGGGLLCAYQDGGEYEATHKTKKKTYKKSKSKGKSKGKKKKSSRRRRS